MARGFLSKHPFVQKVFEEPDKVVVLHDAPELGAAAAAWRPGGHPAV